VPEPDANLNKTLDQVLGIVTRRRWWIILSAAVTSLATLFSLSRIPNRYTSEATLLVVQQQVPQRYVLPTTTTDIREALQATTQEVLSRTRLLAIIDEFGLYANEKKHLSPEGVLDRMRQDIGIQPLESQSERRDVNSFKISFISSKPHLAQEVAGKLTSLFIEQNLETREHQATTTTNFLREQLETAKNKLAEAEDQVRSFKMLHLGELPEQEQGNVTILGGLQAQLQGTLSSLNRAREQRQYLESLSDNRALMIQGDLNRLQSQREALLLRFTPEYPAIKRLDVKIAQMDALLATLRTSQTSVARQAAASQATSDFGIAEDTSIAQINGQLESNRLEIENLLKEQKRMEASIAQYQNRINQTPVREQELAGMLRNYDLMKQDYADLLNKKMQSELSTDLEKRQEGQQFRLVDQPSLPTVPSSPNRIKISLGGLAAGIGLGFALGFLMDFKDRSFHSEEGVSQRFALPFVIGVPLLLTPIEQRTRGLRRNFEWAFGSGLTLFVVAAELYELYLYRHF
jgi:polysaccharide chain length determinant protein (PEP-CTERM system associated)